MNHWQTHYKVDWIRLLILAILFCCSQFSAVAQKTNSINEDIRILTETTDAFRNQVLALLTIIKEFEKSRAEHGPVKSVSGTRIRQQDKDMVDNQLLKQLIIMIRDIEDQYASLQAGIIRLEKKSLEHASGLQPGDSMINQRIGEIKSKIEKYYSYATKFSEPYSHYIIPAKVTDKKQRISSSNKFSGKFSVGLGQTVQNSAGEVSGFAGNMAFNGIYRVNYNTSITGGIRYQEEVIRTPFASLRTDAGFRNTFNNQVKLNANIGYDTYNDKQLNSNDFDVFRAGLSIFVPLGNQSGMSGSLYRGLRTYNLENGNDFASTRYQINLSLSKDRNSVTNLFVRGNIQSGQRDFLNFNQLNPGILYTKRRDPSRLYTMLIELNQFEYAGEAISNNFSRGRLDMKWIKTRDPKSTTILLGVLGKIYPYDERLDYLRANAVISSTKQSLESGRSKTTSFRSSYTYHLQSLTIMDYLDMRFDWMNRGRKAYINFNMFGRMYNAYYSDEEVYQMLDMFLTAGPIITNRSTNTNNNFYLRIGPILGSHLLIGSENDFWENNGTSFRAGITVQGSINIKKASLRFMGSYEKQILVTNNYDIDFETGDLIIGDTYYREPNSFQLYLDFNMPAGRAWDIFFNVNYYNIKTGATEDLNPNANEQNMRQRIIGGLVYKFVL